MTILLRILIIPMFASQLDALFRGKKSGLGQNPRMTDAGLRLGGIVGAALSILAFTSGSWLYAIIAFISQCSVQETISELQTNRFSMGKFIAQIVIIGGLVFWKLSMNK